ncbi:MAG: hypothetical protein IT370_29575 [Deltaproteobacteria bacterium]|nr:hypothetical protein [Deltaproteobacteria bacterium]
MDDTRSSGRSQLPQGFHSQALHSTGSGGVLLAGWLQGGQSWSIDDRRAAIVLAHGDFVTQSHHGPGWIEALDVNGAAIWAVAATLREGGTGSVYRLLGSRDGGVSFTGQGLIPVASVVQVLAAGGDEVWVLGADTLARSTDGGASWHDVNAPGRRDPARERLSVGGGRIIIVGDGVHASADHGDSWVSHLAGVEVHAVVGALLLATIEGKVSFGVMAPAGPRWLRTFDQATLPFSMVASAARVAFLSRDATGPGLLYWRSEDSGRTWACRRVAASEGEHGASLDPAGGLLMLDLARRLVTEP